MRQYTFMTGDAIMEFDAAVSPFDRKAVIQIGAAFGIPFGALLILITLYGGESTKYALIFILMVLMLGLLAGFFVFRRKYVHFSLYDDRIVRIDLPRSVGKARSVADTTVLTGLLKNDATTIATGLLVQTEDAFPMTWGSIAKVVINGNSITLGCKGDEMRIPCEGELHSRIMEILEEKVPAKKITRN